MEDDGENRNLVDASFLHLDRSKLSSGASSGNVSSSNGSGGGHGAVDPFSMRSHRSSPPVSASFRSSGSYGSSVGLKRMRLKTGGSSSGGGANSARQASLAENIDLEQLKQLKAIFDSFDKDGGGGELDLDEFIEAFGDILGRDGSGRPIEDPEKRHKMLQTLFVRIDANASCGVSWEELSTFVLMGNEGLRRMRDDMSPYEFLTDYALSSTTVSLRMREAEEKVVRDLQQADRARLDVARTGNFMQHLRHSVDSPQSRSSKPGMASGGKRNGGSDASDEETEETDELLRRNPFAFLDGKLAPAAAPKGSSYGNVGGENTAKRRSDVGHGTPSPGTLRVSTSGLSHIRRNDTFLHCHHDMASGIFVGHRGNRIASVGLDGAVRFWLPYGMLPIRDTVVPLDEMSVVTHSTMMGIPEVDRLAICESTGEMTIVDMDKMCAIRKYVGVRAGPGQSAELRLKRVMQQHGQGRTGFGGGAGSIGGSGASSSTSAFGSGSGSGSAAGGASSASLPPSMALPQVPVTFLEEIPGSIVAASFLPFLNARSSSNFSDYPMLDKCLAFCATDLGTVALYDLIPRLAFDDSSLPLRRPKPLVKSMAPPGRTLPLLQQLQVHKEWITAIEAVHQIESVVTASMDSTLKISSIEMGRVTQTLVGHSRVVKTFALNWGKKLIASIGPERSVFLWNPYINHPLGYLDGHKAPISKILFLSDLPVVASSVLQSQYPQAFGGSDAVVSSLLVSLSEDKCVKVWDVRMQRCLQSFDDLGSEYVPVNQLTGICYDPIYRRLLTIGNYVKQWPMRKSVSDCPEGTVEGHTRGVIRAVYNAVFSQVVSVDEFSVLVWDVASGRLTFRFESQKRILSAEFDYSGRRLLTGHPDGSVLVWNYVSGQILKECVVDREGELAAASQAAAAVPSVRGQGQNNGSAAALPLSAKNQFISAAVLQRRAHPGHRRIGDASAIAFVEYGVHNMKYIVAGGWLSRIRSWPDSESSRETSEIDHYFDDAYPVLVELSSASPLAHHSPSSASSPSPSPSPSSSPSPGASTAPIVEDIFELFADVTSFAWCPPGLIASGNDKGEIVVHHFNSGRMHWRVNTQKLDFKSLVRTLDVNRASAAAAAAAPASLPDAESASCAQRQSDSETLRVSQRASRFIVEDLFFVEARHLILACCGDGHVRGYDVVDGTEVMDVVVSRTGTTAMVKVLHFELSLLMVCSDSQGCVSVFDISSVWTDKNRLAKNSPVLRNVFKVQDDPISSLSVIEAPIFGFITTDVLSRKINLWTLGGVFVGAFGQLRSWDLMQPRSFTGARDPRLNAKVLYPLQVVVSGPDAAVSGAALDDVVPRGSGSVRSSNTVRSTHRHRTGSDRNSRGDGGGSSDSGSPADNSSTGVQFAPDGSRLSGSMTTAATPTPTTATATATATTAITAATGLSMSAVLRDVAGPVRRRFQLGMP